MTSLLTTGANNKYKFVISVNSIYCCLLQYFGYIWISNLCEVKMFLTLIFSISTD